MKNWILLGVMFSMVFVACNNDDDAAPEAGTPLELSEVIAEDNAEIETFLDTHFYNYEEFASPPADFDFIIDIDTIAGDNSDKTPLSQQMERLTIDLNSDDLGLDGDETVEHAYYMLRVRERMPDGPKPTTADSTFLKYEGQLLDGTSFDENQNFTWLELPFTVRGFAEGASELVAGTSDNIVDNPDGTVDITDRGIGMVIFPSAMGYFAGGGPSGTIPAYSPLLFKLDIGLFVDDTDRDNDGIPSFSMIIPIRILNCLPEIFYRISGMPMMIRMAYPPEMKFRMRMGTSLFLIQIVIMMEPLITWTQTIRNKKTPVYGRYFFKRLSPL